ncbi:ABC transporter permease [Leptolyngbya sp. KIOST-1]|uniref:ABC transporter permease n=1 Tax=Leptolyngbya sp. KIOST-1 TaxID=1229172 RepID=UPI0009DCD700|nr:ABC transporter permease [Leptolyngbya sp. KIOST-1]
MVSPVSPSPPTPEPQNRLRVPKRPARPAIVQVYRPASEMRRPLQLFRRMGADLLASRELAWQLMKRDISAQYRESFLGVAWAIIPPIIASAGFAFAASAEVINVGETDIPYPAYVLLSTALWQTFSEAVMLPMQKVTLARMMLSKIQFPREALILAATGQVLFNFAFKLLLVAGMFAWFRLPVPLSLVLAPVALLHLVLLGTVMGMFLAPMSALYQDFQKGMQLLLGTWLFLTPVVYPPPQSDGLFGFLVQVNPVTPLLVTTRELMTVGTISDPQGFWLMSAIVFMTLPVAWLVYRLAMPYAIERFSS